MDDLLLQEVDDELTAMPIEPVDETNSITSVEVSPKWNVSVSRPGGLDPN